MTELLNDNTYHSYLSEQQITLYQFLCISKKLLIKSRKVLLPSMDNDNNSTTSDNNNRPLSSSDLNANQPIDASNTNLIWQTTMEEGFLKLLASMQPFLKDLKMAEHLFKK